MGLFSLMSNKTVVSSEHPSGKNLFLSCWESVSFCANFNNRRGPNESQSRISMLFLSSSSQAWPGLEGRECHVTMETVEELRGTMYGLEKAGGAELYPSSLSDLLQDFELRTRICI